MPWPQISYSDLYGDLGGYGLGGYGYSYGRSRGAVDPYLLTYAGWADPIIGVAITPEVGLKIDFGKPGGFFIQPGIKVPVTLGGRYVLGILSDGKYGFGVGVGIVPYCGLGIAL